MEKPHPMTGETLDQTVGELGDDSGRSRKELARSKTGETLALGREWVRKIREERGMLAEERKGEMDQPLREGFWQDPVGQLSLLGPVGNF